MGNSSLAYPLRTQKYSVDPLSEKWTRCHVSRFTHLLSIASLSHNLLNQNFLSQNKDPQSGLCLATFYSKLHQTLYNVGCGSVVGSTTDLDQ